MTLNTKKVVFPEEDEPLTPENVEHIWKYTEQYLSVFNVSLPGNSLMIVIDYALDYINNEILKTNRLMYNYGFIDVARERIMYLTKEKDRIKSFKTRYINTPEYHHTYTNWVAELYYKFSN